MGAPCAKPQGKYNEGRFIKVLEEGNMRNVYLAWMLAVLGLTVGALAQNNTSAASTAAGSNDSTSTAASSKGAPSFKSFKEAYTAGNDALKDRKFEESA